MEYVERLERTLAAWYGRLPHLPEKGRRWVADNSWWIVLIGTIVMALGMIGVLSVLLAGTMVLSVFAGLYGAVFGGILALLTLLWIGLYVLTTVLMAMAINPLRMHAKKGWRLLLWVMTIGVAVEITYVFVSADVGSFIWSMIVTALGSYVLFEIRHYFTETAKVHHAKAIKATKSHSDA